MTKPELLRFLVQAGDVDAHEAAEAFGLPYPAAAMALLRLTRQGLVARRLDPDSGLYWYALTGKGLDRLVYFQDLNHSAA